MKPLFTIDQICEVVHEVNRALQRIAEATKIDPPWVVCTWQKNSTREAVLAIRLGDRDLDTNGEESFMAARSE